MVVEGSSRIKIFRLDIFNLPRSKPSSSSSLISSPGAKRKIVQEPLSETKIKRSTTSTNTCYENEDGESLMESKSKSKTKSPSKAAATSKSPSKSKSPLKSHTVHAAGVAPVFVPLTVTNIPIQQSGPEPYLGANVGAVGSDIVTSKAVHVDSGNIGEANSSQGSEGDGVSDAALELVVAVLNDEFLSSGGVAEQSVVERTAEERLMAMCHKGGRVGTDPGETVKLVLRRLERCNKIMVDAGCLYEI